MDYLALKAELAQPAYAGLTDAQILAALRAKVLPVLRDVPTADARPVLLRSGAWGALEITSRRNPATPEEAQLVGAAITILETCRTLEVIYTTDLADWALVQAMLVGFVAAGVMTQATRDQLEALRTVQVSRAEQIGCPAVDLQAILTARRS